MLGTEFARENNFPDSENTLESLRNTRLTQFASWPGHSNALAEFITTLICAEFASIHLMFLKEF